MANARTLATRSAHNAQAALEAQIAELREELDGISKNMRSRGYDWAGQASDVAGELATTARRQALSAARTARHEANIVAETVREHPVSASAALTTVAAIGFAIGYMLAATTTEKKRFW